jgi:hypothetical protein
MKNNKLFIVILLFLLASFALTACQEQEAPQQQAIQIDGFDIILTEPDVDFPDSITFEIEIESAVDISGISLQYQVEKLNVFPVTSVTFPEFEPATHVNTSWEWNLRTTGGLPPGTDLSYWWSIEDSEGHTAQTPVDTLSFDDERHSWRSLSSNNVDLLWYEGSESFAEQLMTAAQEALARLAEDTGAQLEDTATIYIYATTQDLLTALIYPQAWTGGIAFTEFRTVAIGISPGNLEWGKGTIAHELAHLVVEEATFSGYGVDLPVWLNEGLAMYAEGELGSDMKQVLRNAIEQDKLFSVKSLCSPFPTDTASAYIAYAQSYSLVEYLIKEHGGRAKMLELLNAFKQGSGYVEALDQVYSLDIDQLNTLWRDYVTW